MTACRRLRAQTAAGPRQRRGSPRGTSRVALAGQRLGRAKALASFAGHLVHGLIGALDQPAFAGREPELRWLSGLLRPDGESPRTVVICAIDGMPGIGKTTVAIHWAHRVAKLFPAGQLYLNLHGFDSSASVTTSADALRALLCSLGVPAEHLPVGLDACAGLYRSIVADKRVLIVLDNARDAEQVRPLLPASPGSVVIVTSRNPLADLVMAEGARLLTLDLPAVSTAIQTLERRLGQDRIAAEPEAVQEIIRRCGRLPLAVAIVSARAAAHPGFTLASIAADLRHAQGRLDAFGTAAMAADARTVFSWSYRQLSPQAGRLFRLLSLLPAADITATASASLLGLPPDEAARLMAELTSTALVAEHRPGRYACHEVIRAYAAELSARSDTDTDRHRPWPGCFSTTCLRVTPPRWCSDRIGSRPRRGRLGQA